MKRGIIMVKYMGSRPSFSKQKGQNNTYLKTECKPTYITVTRWGNPSYKVTKGFRRLP